MKYQRHFDRKFRHWFIGSLAAFTLIQPAVAEIDATVDLTPRIIGGQPAPAEHTQWVAAILNSAIPNPADAQFCGGTFIKENWVVTAAHCVVNSSPVEIDVLLGQSNLAEGNGVRAPVQQIIIHPDYSELTLDNDIALLLLGLPVSVITPMKLPGQVFDNPVAKEGIDSVVLGWGNTDTNSPTFPDDLMMASIPIISNTACNSAYPGWISDFHVCAGLPEGSKDSCQGDSGGPMVMKSRQTNQSWILSGVVSWGTGCAEPGFPGVYTRVASFIEWITANICSAAEIPPAPVITVTVSGTELTVTVEPISGVTGYRLYIARPGFVEFDQYDIGNKTMVTANLPSGTDILVGGSAYNNNCSSALSNFEQVVL